MFRFGIYRLGTGAGGLGKRLDGVGNLPRKYSKNFWAEAGVRSYRFDGKEASEAVANAVREASHVLVTIPPQKDAGDVVLKHFEKILTDSSQLQWLGYLSTTGVYGNRDGGWVDETSELKPGFDHQIGEWKRKAMA